MYSRRVIHGKSCPPDARTGIQLTLQILVIVVVVVTTPAAWGTGSRAILAKELYRRGAQMESSGDFGGALRLWTYARKLEPANGFFEREVSWIREFVQRMAEQKMKEAVFDVQHGRNERALVTLMWLRGTTRGVNEEISKKIEMLISTIKAKEKM